MWHQITYFSCSEHQSAGPWILQIGALIWFPVLKRNYSRENKLAMQCKWVECQNTSMHTESWALSPFVLFDCLVISFKWGLIPRWYYLTDVSGEWILLMQLSAPTRGERGRGRGEWPSAAQDSVKVEGISIKPRIVSSQPPAAPRSGSGAAFHKFSQLSSCRAKWSRRKADPATLEPRPA